MADYDAIVIGGGFAGVTTARELRTKGISCLMLEARDRLGGRTYWTEFAGHRVEFGGTWIHWSQPHVWAEVTRYGLEIVESPRVQNALLLTRGERNEVFVKEFSTLSRLFDRILREGRSIRKPYDPRWYDNAAELDRLSLQDKIDSTELTVRESEFISAMLAGIWGNRLSEIGLLGAIHHYSLAYSSIHVYMDMLGRYRLANGTRALVDSIIADSGAQVMLSTPVTEIKQDSSEVIVTTKARESYSARAAIVAVPINVLATIEFSPPLMDGKLYASREHHSGIGVKSWSLVEGVPKNFIGVGPGAGFQIIQSEHEVSEGALMVGFAADGRALDISDPAAVERAIRAFVPEAKVLAVGGHDWLADPYSRGVWSAWPPGRLTRYTAALQHPEGRLVFAGSDTASGWSINIDGAIETGLRAAREVSQLLG